jgi:hypothetical protein
MAYIVERYLTGLDQTALRRSLGRLKGVTAELRREGTQVHYLGSTIVLEDEACYCSFEASSEAAVAEANRRAGLPYDRIVGAVSVPRSMTEQP